jgi:hypothetical protein
MDQWIKHIWKKNLCLYYTCTEFFPVIRHPQETVMFSATNKGLSSESVTHWHLIWPKGSTHKKTRSIHRYNIKCFHVCCQTSQSHQFNFSPDRHPSRKVFVPILFSRHWVSLCCLSCPKLLGSNNLGSQVAGTIGTRKHAYFPSYHDRDIGSLTSSVYSEALDPFLNIFCSMRQLCLQYLFIKHTYQPNFMRVPWASSLLNNEYPHLWRPTLQYVGFFYSSATIKH